MSKQETVSKNEIIEAQADQILALLKEVEDVEKDYKKLSTESRYFLKTMDSKDVIIHALRKKVKWNIADIILAIVVSGIFLGIGTTL